MKHITIVVLAFGLSIAPNVAADEAAGALSTSWTDWALSYLPRVDVQALKGIAEYVPEYVKEHPFLVGGALAGAAGLYGAYRWYNALQKASKVVVDISSDGFVVKQNSSIRYYVQALRSSKSYVSSNTIRNLYLNGVFYDALIKDQLKDDIEYEDGSTFWRDNIEVVSRDKNAQNQLLRVLLTEEQFKQFYIESCYKKGTALDHSIVSEEDIQKLGPYLVLIGHRIVQKLNYKDKKLFNSQFPIRYESLHQIKRLIEGNEYLIQSSQVSPYGAIDIAILGRTTRGCLVVSMAKKEYDSMLIDVRVRRQGIYSLQEDDLGLSSGTADVKYFTALQEIIDEFKSSAGKYRLNDKQMAGYTIPYLGLLDGDPVFRVNISEYEALKKALGEEKSR